VAPGLGLWRWPLPTATLKVSSFTDTLSRGPVKRHKIMIHPVVSRITRAAVTHTTYAPAPAGAQQQDEAMNFRQYDTA
jgi:hypothetical protein